MTKPDGLWNQDEWNPAYEDPINPGLWIHDYCSCEGDEHSGHDYDCENEEDEYDD